MNPFRYRGFCLHQIGVRALSQRVHPFVVSAQSEPAAIITARIHAAHLEAQKLRGNR